MVIFIQATADRYNPYLDFECRSSALPAMSLHSETSEISLTCPRPDHRINVLEHARSRFGLYSHEFDRRIWPLRTCFD